MSGASYRARHPEAAERNRVMCAARRHALERLARECASRFRALYDEELARAGVTRRRPGRKGFTPEELLTRAGKDSG